MTIEFSLRRRAAQARWLAILWLSLATLILVLADKLFESATKIEFQTVGTSSNVSTEAVDYRTFSHVQFYALGTLALGLAAISFACFLLGRSAFVEIELSARCSGFADALCIAGEDFAQLEKAASILMPSTKYLSVPEIFSTNDLKSWVEVLKQIRPG
jgi:hypothetical protein